MTTELTIRSLARGDKPEWQNPGTDNPQDPRVLPPGRGTGGGGGTIAGVHAAADAARGASVLGPTRDLNETARRLYDRIGTVTPFIKYCRT